MPSYPVMGMRETLPESTSKRKRAPPLTLSAVRESSPHFGTHRSSKSVRWFAEESKTKGGSSDNMIASSAPTASEATARQDEKGALMTNGWSSPYRRAPSCSNSQKTATNNSFPPSKLPAAPPHPHRPKGLLQQLGAARPLEMTPSTAPQQPARERQRGSERDSKETFIERATPSGEHPTDLVCRPKSLQTRQSWPFGPL